VDEEELKMPDVISPVRVEIAAPDGYTVLNLERRLAKLAHTRVGEARGWVLELEGVEALDEVEVAVADWLRDSGLASTHMVVGGRHVHVDASPAPAVEGSDEPFAVHADSAPI
jgi:hypothetical protein